MNEAQLYFRTPNLLALGNFYPAKVSFDLMKTMIFSESILPKPPNNNLSIAISSQIFAQRSWSLPDLEDLAAPRHELREQMGRVHRLVHGFGFFQAGSRVVTLEIYQLGEAVFGMFSGI